MHEIGLSGDFEACHKLWTDMIDLYDFCFDHGDMYRATSLGKEMVRIAGVAMGEYERLPLQRPSEEDRQMLKKLMKVAGMAV
jgi:dihydrodipicolinate synthase/N-acetylneuraminate lyase